MNTELQNIQQQVSALQENTYLITQDIVRIMPRIVALLSENEKNMQEFHEMRTKDQELLQQIKQFIKRENDVLSNIIKDYGTLQDVAGEISTITRQELAILTIKEKEIVSKNCLLFIVNSFECLQPNNFLQSHKMSPLCLGRLFC